MCSNSRNTSLNSVYWHALRIGVSPFVMGLPPSGNSALPLTRGFRDAYWKSRLLNLDRPAPYTLYGGGSVAHTINDHTRYGRLVFIQPAFAYRIE